MKICACIAEYNPFHLGHLKHIDYIKNVLGAEKIIVVMSGNFTQRGEPAVLDKFTRAKHAIIAGADLVIELPTVFATANAETFATGAVNLISSLGCVDGLCFGVESGNKDAYLKLATAMNNETKEVYVNEINTIPGSLAFYLWEAKGVSYKELINRLVALAFKRQRVKENLNFTIDTNILNGNFGGIKK
jgi:predicted nucleotidyltransferase